MCLQPFRLLYIHLSDLITSQSEEEYVCSCSLAAADEMWRLQEDDSAPDGVRAATSCPACSRPCNTFVLLRQGESPLLPLRPTFISSLPIKHDLSAHFAWRHLIACC